MISFIFNLLKISIGAISILLFGLLIYIKPLWQNKYTQKELNSFVKNIKEAPEVPGNFIELYKDLYPTRLTIGYLNSKLTIGHSSICSETVYPVDSHLSIPEKLSFYHELENRVDQHQCLKCLLNKYDFLNQAIGISSASEIYFQKSVQELSLEEQLTLIVMLENSALYNPLQRPELVLHKVELLKGVLNKLTN